MSEPVGTSPAWPRPRRPRGFELASSLRAYGRVALRGDLIAGVSAGWVVIPQAMAYATIAEMPVEVGLYTCMVPMVVYAFLGGSRVLSVSTTSTIVTLTASSLVAAGVVVGSDDAIGDLGTLALLVGGILFATRVLRLGPLVDNVSEALLTGLKVAVGLTVAAGQLPALLGVAGEASADNFFAEARSALGDLGDANGATVLLGAGTIGLLLLLRRVAPRVPAPLVAVAAGIALVALFDLPDHGVALIAEIPRGLPTPELPAFDHVGKLVPGAVAIALMAFLETVTVGRSVRRPTDPSIDNDQELTAVGAASVGGAFFQALPPAGGFSQTAVNQSAGARTQVSELATATLAVLTALLLAPLLDDLPRATLAALVVVAVLGLINPAEWAFLARFDKLELFVAALTAIVGLSAGLLAAVAVGVAANLLLVLHELNHPGLIELRPGPGGTLLPADGRLDPVPGLLVLRIGAPLYTANVRVVQREVLARVDEAQAAEGAGTAPRVVVLEASAVGRLSTTVLAVMQETDQQLADRRVTQWVASLPPRALAMARLTSGWVEWTRDGRLHPTAEAAVRAFQRSGGTRAPRP